jgi:hypothetical protein
VSSLVYLAAVVVTNKRLISIQTSQ